MPDSAAQETVTELRKPRLLLLLGSDRVIRDFTESGTLAALARAFDVRFCAPFALVSRLETLGTVDSIHRTNRIRFWLWSNLNILLSTMMWKPIVGQMGRDFYNRKWTNSYRGFLKVLVAIDRLKLGRAATWIAQRLLNVTLWQSVRHKGRRPDLVFAISQMRDMPADDLLRWARRERIPSVVMQANLDSLNMKTPTAMADHWVVWGDQSWYFANLVYEVPARALKVVGSPRFDAYRSATVTKAEALRRLGVPPGKRCVLFCGGAPVFNETRLLRQIESAIGRGDLPADLWILYKPHPTLGAEAFSDPFDPAAFPHVQVVATERRKETPLAEFSVLFAASIAAITPFSTMGLEAAVHGLPVLCVGYHDSNPRFWAFNNHIHHRAFLDKPWSVICYDEGKLIPGVHRLLDLAARPETANFARNDARHAAAVPPGGVPEALCRHLQWILSNPRTGDYRALVESEVGEITDTAEGQVTSIRRATV